MQCCARRPHRLQIVRRAIAAHAMLHRNDEESFSDRQDEMPGASRFPLRIFALSVVLYTAAFAMLSWPWLSGAVTIPWDAKAQFQPEMQFLASSLAHGESPFWTPNLFAGWPQIADPQSLIFSPLHFALAVLDASPSFRETDFITFAYLFIGGLGLMLFFRDRGWHAGGGLIAALILAFGGSAASRLQHTGQIVSLAYVPIALWLVARTLERASLGSALAAGIVVGLLAIGRDQVAMLGLYLVAFYVLAWWLDGPRPSPFPKAGAVTKMLAVLRAPWARIKPTLVPLTVCGVVAIALALVPLVLSGLLAADSNRPMVGLEEAGRGSLHPAHLLMLAFADLFSAEHPNVDFWGPPSAGWHATIGSTGLYLAQNVGEIYCGILAVILVLGTGFARGALWAREIRFFPFALTFALLYALGWYTPAFRFMYDLIPGVELFRRPADATFIIGLLLAVNTGYLVHRLLGGTASAPRWWFALEGALIAVFIGFAVAIACEANQVGLAMVPIATGIAFAAGAIALLWLTRRLAPARPVLASVLLFGFTTGDLAWNNAPSGSSGLPPSRYDALRPDGNETVALLKAKLAGTFGADRRDRVELIGIAYYWPDVALAQGFDHLFGHNPLRLHDFALATGVGDTVAEPSERTFAPLFPSYRSTMANLCGVRFIVTGVPIEAIDTSLHVGDFKLIARTKDAYVYENPRALPRVMVVPEYAIADFDEMIRKGWPDTDPRRTVLLEHPPAAPAPAGAAKAGDGTARIMRYANTEIDVEVDAPGGGFLVVNDAWHPWWRAEVDGQPTDILKANVLFRAVQIAPGLHQVHFEFEPLQGAWDELRQKVAGAVP
jgi:hypothetical protein